MKLRSNHNHNSIGSKTSTSKDSHLFKQIRVFCSKLKPVLETLVLVSQIMRLNYPVPPIIPQPGCNPMPAQQEQVNPTPAQQEQITSTSAQQEEITS